MQVLWNCRWCHQSLIRIRFSVITGSSLLSTRYVFCAQKNCGKGSIKIPFGSFDMFEFVWNISCIIHHESSYMPISEEQPTLSQVAVISYIHITTPSISYRFWTLKDIILVKLLKFHVRSETFFRDLTFSFNSIDSSPQVKTDQIVRHLWMMTLKWCENISN